MNDTTGLDTEPLDMSSHDQTPDMSMDNAVSIRDAAAIAGVTEKTIRRWIKSGRLPAMKLGGQYRITIAALETASTATIEGNVQDIREVSTQQTAPGHDSPRVDMSEGLDTGHDESGHATESVDLAPLTALIDDLTRRNADLAAAAAMWQTRAAHLENEIKQLQAGTPEATEKPTETPTIAPESPQTNETAPTGIRKHGGAECGADRVDIVMPGHDSDNGDAVEEIEAVYLRRQCVEARDL
jgi:excisionase family DNA binding protein